MFSRLSARTSSLASRSLRVATPSLARTFKSTPALWNAAAAAPTTAQNPVEIVNKYGATTFWGMVAAIMITKEVYILDAEFLLSMEIAGFVLAGYVVTGDTINKMSEEWDAKTTAKFEGANDFMIEMFNQYKMVQGVVQNKPEVLQQYAVEYKDAIEAFAAFKSVQPAHVARAEVLAALAGIQAKEEFAAHMEWQNTVDSATAAVTAAFSKGDTKLNDEMLELAIKNLGFEVGVSAEASDPVKRLFMAQFSE